MRSAGRGPILALALATALAAAVTTGCSPRPVYRAHPEEPTRSGAPAPGPRPSLPAGLVEEVASGWLGTRYRYGGVDERGIDCSALVQNVLGDLGARVPRTTKAQRRAGREVELAEVRPGDLLFFRLESASVNHVAIALGRDRFIHASSSRGVVVDRLMDDYFSRRFVEARRVLGDP